MEGVAEGDTGYAILLQEERLQPLQSILCCQIMDCFVNVAVDELTHTNIRYQSIGSNKLISVAAGSTAEFYLMMSGD